MPDFDLSYVLLGASGGLLPDAIRFARQRYEGFPQWFRRPGYWVGLLVLVLLGALAAWLGEAKDWKAALAMGFAAPEVISRLLGSDQPTVRDVGGFPIRKWWSK
jgi:hypothetical protein